MATTKRNPLPSVEILFLRHSKARVLVPSTKRFVTGQDTLTGAPTFGHPLFDEAVISRWARYWSKR